MPYTLLMGRGQTTIHDHFSAIMGGRRGLPAGFAHDDEDVILSFVSGKPVSSPHFLIEHYPEGPLPEIIFLVDPELRSEDKLRGHGVVALRHEDEDCITFEISPSLDDALTGPIAKFCREDGARVTMTEMVRLGSDYDHARGERTDRLESATPTNILVESQNALA